MNRQKRDSSILIHETAIVEKEVKVSNGVQIWAFAHVRQGVELGENVIVGDSVYIGPMVKIGSNSKIQNNAQIYGPVEIGTGVFIGPAVVLTNDRLPRSVTPEGEMKNFMDWKPSKVSVEDGASIGAGVICVAPVQIGKFAMIGAGSVVNRDIAAFERVVGNPVRNIGWSCACGERLSHVEVNLLLCFVCGFKYKVSQQGVEKLIEKD